MPLSGLRRYGLLTIGLLLFFLLIFALAQAAQFGLLTDPTPWLQTHGEAAGALGVTLLVLDVVLPTPSSLIMVAHGALFGVWLGGLLSLLGAVGATLTGFAIGRLGEEAIQRIVTPSEHERAALLFERWGTLAIVVTRPVPLLAETVAILAGASSLSWLRILLASIIGSLPAAFLYALAGATAAYSPHWLLVFFL